MRWRTQKLDHAAHKQLPGKRLPPWKRGRRNFLHPPRVLQSALSGPSEMWDGAYFNRNPPVTHKRTNISSQWFITARLHDTNSVQWCRACLLKNKQRKGKRYYFTARASGLCYDCGSTNPHTLILCTTLLYLWGRTTATVKPITALKCELVILKIIHLYTVVRFIPIQQHTTASCAGSIACITCQDCRRTNAEEHSSANGQTGGWKRVTENKVQCFHSTTASLQRTSMSNTGTLEL